MFEASCRYQSGLGGTAPGSLDTGAISTRYVASTTSRASSSVKPAVGPAL